MTVFFLLSCVSVFAQYFFFFFKQKTAYEMRISDWSSDVCSSDLKLSTPRRGCSGLAYSVDYVTSANPMDERIDTPGGALFVDGASILYLIEIGRASCRERVCQYV